MSKANVPYIEIRVSKKEWKKLCKDIADIKKTVGAMQRSMIYGSHKTYERKKKKKR